MADMQQKKSKAQAGLEYLMTYGWALIIIVTVAGILFFVMSSPAQGVSFSSDTRDFIVRSSNVSTGTPAPFTVQLQNASGKLVTITTIQSSNFTFNAPYDNCNPCATPIPVASGQTITLTGTTSSYTDSGAIAIDYKIDNYTKKLNVSAKGTIPGTTSSGCNGPEECTASLCNTPTCIGSTCGQSPIGQFEYDYINGCYNNTGCNSGGMLNCYCNGTGACQALCFSEGECADNKCYEPTCTGNVCGETFVPNGGTDEACYANTGCSGGGCKCNGAGSCSCTTC